MADSKSLILITGANSGLGLELTSRLLADASKHVLLGSRSAEKGQAAVKDLQSRKLPGTVELLQINVDDEQSIAAAAKSVESKYGSLLTKALRLDALVNNAAVAFGDGDGPLAQRMAATYKTNTIGPQLTVEAFTPLLERSKQTPRIVNVSTGVSSMALHQDPTFPYNNVDNIAYRASKSALNMTTVHQAMRLGEKGFKIFAYCPGFIVSNLSEFNNLESGAAETSTGAIPMLKILNGERDAEHSYFLQANGQYPW